MADIEYESSVSSDGDDEFFDTPAYEAPTPTVPSRPQLPPRPSSSSTPHHDDSTTMSISVDAVQNMQQHASLSSSSSPPSTVPHDIHSLAAGNISDSRSGAASPDTPRSVTDSSSGSDVEDYRQHPVTTSGMTSISNNHSNSPPVSAASTVSAAAAVGSTSPHPRHGSRLPVVMSRPHVPSSQLLTNALMASSASSTSSTSSVASSFAVHSGFGSNAARRHSSSSHLTASAPVDPAHSTSRSPTSSTPVTPDRKNGATSSSSAPVDSVKREKRATPPASPANSVHSIASLPGPSRGTPNVLDPIMSRSTPHRAAPPLPPRPALPPRPGKFSLTSSRTMGNLHSHGASSNHTGANTSSSGSVSASAAPPLPVRRPEAKVISSGSGPLGIGAQSAPVRRITPAGSTGSSGSSIANEIDDPSLLPLDDPRYQIRNLDTNERIHIRDADQAMPMTLTTFDRHMANRAQVNDEKGPAVQQNDAEISERKRSLGFMGRMRNAFKRGSGSSGKPGGNKRIKVKSKKGQTDLPNLKLVQDTLQHADSIWTAKFSPDGHFLATGGQDSIVRVWVVAGSPTAAEFEEKLRNSPAARSADNQVNALKKISLESGGRAIVIDTPFRMYSGHTADVIDIAWSKANFLLSASIDNTVRLWHVSRSKCLHMFQHSDFVTTVNFHPIEDRFFISGSFDRKLRIWNIPEHCVVEYAQTADIITSATFSPNGKMAVAGLVHGQCVLYQTDGLKYFTQIDCRNRRGKHSKGEKVTGLQFTPDGKRLLITTNDSRARLYDMEDYSCIAKYKGLRNDQLPIGSTFSEDSKLIICGSEDHCVYVWKTMLDDSKQNRSYVTKGTSNKQNKERNASYDCFKAHSDIVTCAAFVPNATISLCYSREERQKLVKSVIMTTSFNGELRFFESSYDPSTNATQ
jgi:WD repeat-containing protein 44